MFKKIVIANRGEIAVRIMATCREMGISTVAVYSEADRHAQHVREADEAYLIGPAPATQSYLRGDTILDVVKRSGAEALHPGYGFLSENAAFADACEQAGVIFIGPPASAMRLMGSKIAAKHLARSVEAPTVPGYNSERQQDEILQREAERVGFPLLIKASAGGGGKGMRTVSSASDFLEQLAGARREARAAFGDDAVFLERLLLRPRHVEIQILGDQHGNLIYLGERECSIQRRHQKIVEESPSVALTPELRAEMGTTAVRIARAAGYTNAGTMEFLLDDDGQFYFLEMNTRLQVEHPVTEFITGLDLVRQQIRIAAGERLEITQDQVTLRGHAIEVRLYAEDATQQFLPSTGTVSAFVKPKGPGIRLDSGVEAGDEISQYYDPMLAKLIVSGEDRPAAIARLQRALESTAIFGLTTNIPFLHTISAHPAFREGHTHINFLQEHRLLETETAQQPIPDEVLMVAALIELADELEIATPSTTKPDQHNPWTRLGPWRMVGEARTITYRYQEQEYKVQVKPGFDAQHSWKLQIGNRPEVSITDLERKDTRIVLRQDAQQLHAYVQQQDSEVQVILHGQLYRLQRRRAPSIAAAASGGSATSQQMLTAPMSGTIVKVQVRDGDMVESHQVLMILSAMKMEHAITASHKGRVRRVLYQEGTVVQGGATVIEMEEAEA